MNTRKSDYVFIIDDDDSILILPIHVMFGGGCDVYDGGGSWLAYS